jgi:hypothetical protein
LFLSSFSIVKLISFSLNLATSLCMVSVTLPFSLHLFFLSSYLF